MQHMTNRDSENRPDCLQEEKEGLAIQSVRHGPAPQASPGRVLDRQTLRSITSPTELGFILTTPCDSFAAEV